ncbi:MAG: alkane 1-monooxygenase [Cyclobacteriaceae bacterium]|jgi:alkane 1-monooxygenase|nr:alkane 1-monooxygenase [Flammeovirgaceae bacterium]
MSGLKKIGFFSAFIIPALVVAGYYLGPWGVWLPVVFVFLFIPVIDYLSGLDTTNVPENDKKIVGEEFYYRLVTYLWTYVQFAFFIWAAWVVTFGTLSTPLAWIGFTISFALVTGGIGITVAHELGHKKSRIERFYSQALLMTVEYMHFYIEHNRGHHVYVATPEDPATARQGENFYSFWFRSVFIGWAHAWKLEKEARERKGLPVWSITNPMIGYALLQLLFVAALTLAFSWAAGKLVWALPVFLVVQSVLAFSLLELVNYVEHYGILRREISPGRYERVNPLHSWNASHLVSNFFLFQLQRHSDHHYNAIKRYQVLDHYEESPQLPFGYPTMILLALVPTLWFGLMDNRLEEWKKSVPAVSSI